MSRVYRSFRRRNICETDREIEVAETEVVIDLRVRECAEEQSRRIRQRFDRHRRLLVLLGRTRRKGRQAGVPRVTRSETDTSLKSTPHSSTQSALYTAFM